MTGPKGEKPRPMGTMTSGRPDGANERPENVELVVTGRGASDMLAAVADLVTEMREVKHYYEEGVLARPGIEF